MSDKENKKDDKTMLVAGVNLGIMFFYTIVIRATGGTDGALLLAFIIGFHFIICLLTSPFIHTKGFLLGALAVLLIGFSTCFLAYTIH
jgi:hypothetical protein